MRRYPFERARPQSMRSETVYIDRDSIDEPAVKPINYPGSPPEMSPLSASQPEAPSMAPISYRESPNQQPVAPLTLNHSEAPSMAPVEPRISLATPQMPQPEARISPIAPPMPQTERSVASKPEAPPELKIEPKRPEQLTDEQLAAIFSNVRQAPRVSLLSMPVSTKLFSEEYADAERL